MLNKANPTTMPQSSHDANHEGKQEAMFVELRRQFPALARRHTSGESLIYLDGPAGSQVPQSVIDAISDYYCHHNANRSGQFATSHETDGLMTDAHAAAAAWFGCDDPDETIFGANMTTLTFQFSRAISRTWTAADSVVITRLDHDANCSPWRLAAADRGACVRVVDVCADDATLDLASFARALESRPKLVAVTAASNSVGTRTPIVQLISMAHTAGAEVYVDAVHYAPHAPIDVRAWGADFVVCSAYKFFGPHVGLLWARGSRLAELDAYKVIPAPNSAPGKWMTGTQNHAAICGVTAAIDYLAAIGRSASGQATLPRRPALLAAMRAIESYERSLLMSLMEGLREIPRIKVYGISDPARFDDRVPTLALVMEGMSSMEVARQLGDRGIAAWHGHYYAVAICEALGHAQDGMVRLGLMHTNTQEEVFRTLRALHEIASHDSSNR